LPSPISPSGSGFLSSSSRSALPSPTDSTPLLLSRPGSQLVSGKETGKEEESRGMVKSLLSPLAVFLPTKHLAPTRNMLHLRYATDWSLTLLAVGLVGWMLSTVRPFPSSLPFSPPSSPVYHEARRNCMLMRMNVL
jgi:hypothetical protein